jgi:type I restriction enzyme S subunit
VKKYEEPEAVDAEKEGLPAIPEGWEWVMVDALAPTVEYGISQAMNKEGPGVPILRMPNIDPGQLTFDDLKYLAHEYKGFPDMYLKPGDVLFNRTNSAKLVGKTAVYHGGDPSPCTFASYLIRIQPICFEPDLLAHFINSPFGDVWLSDARSQQVGQANVSGSKLKELRIPLIPETEQREIKRAVEDELTLLRSMAARVSSAEMSLERLSSSMLSSALSGSTPEAAE